MTTKRFDTRTLLLTAHDPEVAACVRSEYEHQSSILDLGASTNYCSAAQLNVLGSVFANTTIEGYPGARMLTASAGADRIEELAIERACRLFGSKYANVQPHSGMQANQAVFFALLRPGDTVLSMNLLSGGHFSHGDESNISGRWFDVVHYGVHPKTGLLDYDEIDRLARECEPRLIIAGASAYPRTIDFCRFERIAKKVNAFLMVDIAHVAGQVVADCFPNPVAFADVVTSTTYKNLPGPHGGLILCNDHVLSNRIDAALSPGLQGTPAVNTIAAKAVAFKEAASPEFRLYCRQININIKILVDKLKNENISILTDGSDTPFVVLDLRDLSIKGQDVVAALQELRINSNVVPLPGDPNFEFSSGVRLGVSGITNRGMGAAEMDEIGGIVGDTVNRLARKDRPLSDYITKVQRLCRRFPSEIRQLNRGTVMNEVFLFVNGENRTGVAGEVEERKNPIDQSVATVAHTAREGEVKLAADAAGAAFQSWSSTGPKERRTIMLKAAEAFEKRRPDFIQAMVSETGASPVWAEFNVNLAKDIVLEAAGLATRIGGEVIPSDVPGSLAMGIRAPVGVVIAMAPWNAPIILGTRAVAIPLVCGNTVIFKGSEKCPQTHRLIVDVFTEAGLGPGILNYIVHKPENAAAVFDGLIAHPAVRRVNFTGSTKVGRIIAEKCATYLKPAILELGGKAPLVVLDDADVQAAVDAAVFGAFLHSGQICMSTERIIVCPKVAMEFVERFARRATQLPVGDARVCPAVLSSVIDIDTVRRANELIADAEMLGADVLCGGVDDSILMKPTVIDKVTPEMRVYHEETFAPVKAIVRAASEEEALKYANDTKYGLASAVFSRDIAKAIRFAQKVEAGICHINGPTVHDEAQMPFGGVKESGYGRFGGMANIENFTELRWITVQTSERRYPF